MIGVGEARIGLFEACDGGFELALGDARTVRRPSLRDTRSDRHLRQRSASEVHQTNQHDY
jgi:hypothetical protein